MDQKKNFNQLKWSIETNSNWVKKLFNVANQLKLQVIKVLKLILKILSLIFVYMFVKVGLNKLFLFKNTIKFIQHRQMFLSGVKITFFARLTMCKKMYIIIEC